MTVEDAAAALVRLGRQVLEGEIPAKVALQTVAQPAVAGVIDDRTLVALSTSARDGVMKNQDRWRTGVVMHALVNACADARPGTSRDTADELAWNWLGLAGIALWHVPDPGLYKDARDRAERALAHLPTDDRKRERAMFLHGLGTLHLDPYAALRSPNSLGPEMRAWRSRAAAGETWDGEAHHDLETEGFPGPEQALTLAKSYYTGAAEAREGRDRALSLKALAQSLHAFAMYDLPADRPAIEAAAREALGLLDPAKDPAFVAELTGYLRFATREPSDAGRSADAAGTPQAAKSEGGPGGAAARGAMTAWLERSLDDSVRTHGSQATRLTIVNTAAILLDSDPARVFTLLCEAAPLFTADEAVQDLTSFHLMAARAFARVHGATERDYPKGDGLSVEDHVKRLAGQAEKEGWDVARLAGALVALAIASVSRDEEHTGERVLRFAESIAPLSLSPLAPTIRYLRTQFFIKAGSNAFGHGELGEAAQQYAMALRQATELGIRPLVGEALARMVDVASRDAAAGPPVVAMLADRVDAIELAGGEPATANLQKLYQLSAQAIVDGQGSGRDLWSIVQLAKSRRFASMLAAGSAHRVTEEDRPAEALARIAEVRASVDPAARASRRSIDDQVLLSPYSRGSVEPAGDSAESRLRSLEHRFDVSLQDALVRKALGVPGLLASEDAVRAALDEETVLVQFYLSEGDDGRDGLLLACVSTREESAWSAQRLGGAQGQMRIQVDGLEAVLTPVSTTIAALRDSLNEDPGANALSDNAARLVSQATDILLAFIEAPLAELRSRGKTHLCIVPHGPLAFAPLHLLGSRGPLADEWVVTTLPSLQLLATHQGQAAIRKHQSQRIAAIGLGFANDPLGYPEIPEAAEEAEAVAQAFGAAPLLDAQAGEPAVIDALRNATFVHIATHGEQRPTAPGFHTLRVAADAGGDGDVFAHELLGLDLRGLELVTLSACETALGRFDTGDNPHGIPATLFLAGARTVIGTLWQVETFASQTFFTTLYQSLAAGAAKRRAFQDALAATRKVRPQWRDWGAFCFSGDWR